MLWLTGANVGNVLGSSEVSSFTASGKRKSIMEEAGEEKGWLVGLLLLSDEKQDDMTSNSLHKDTFQTFLRAHYPHGH